jgi:very-short-patch-repair endonuclease
MAGSRRQSAAIWQLARRQHGVIERKQLAALGLSGRAIEHRIATGRLHPVRIRVYAVGRPELTRHGHWMAAVLALGETAVLSHSSAAALWGVSPELTRQIEVSIRTAASRQGLGLRVHRQLGLQDGDTTAHAGIPVTAVPRTLMDLATRVDRIAIERMINEADKRGLVSPEALRASLGRYRGQRGVRRLRELLDSRTFRLTDSELERRFLALVRSAGLPMPLTGQRVNGFKVDFYWAELGLVVETDGLTYHRTSAQQARDRIRDQAHTAAGLTQLRFAHTQVRFEAEQVAATLSRVVRRLEASRAA